MKICCKNELILKTIDVGNKNEDVLMPSRLQLDFHCVGVNSYQVSKEATFKALCSAFFIVLFKVHCPTTKNNKQQCVYVSIC